MAEIFGGVAIIVTLAFLAVQMRENTEAIRAQTFQELQSQLNDWRSFGTVQPEFIEAMEKFQSKGWEGLDAVESLRVWSRFVTLWAIFESAYIANERGVLGEIEWRRFERGACRRFAVSQQQWDPPDSRDMKNLLTPEFVSFIETTCR
jgi:hypothetical protein